VCSVRLGGSDFTSGASDSDSDSDFRTCSVSDLLLGLPCLLLLPPCSVFGLCLLSSSRIIVRPLGHNRRAPRTIVRFNPVDPGFFGLRTSQLFGIWVAVRAAAHLPIGLLTHHLSAARGQLTNYCSLSPS
jgi:hypothetical protein